MYNSSTGTLRAEEKQVARSKEKRAICGRERATKGRLNEGMVRNTPLKVRGVDRCENLEVVATKAKEKVRYVMRDDE
jgi:hypothetical protein